ncbi:hypothetical protein TNCV_3455541 [Trichonephila clavipes]|nr:hypothetical protein TNCV_3455541 [Trichonephila clavipes]
MKERPASEITPPQGEAGGRKRPNEDETRVRHEGENGRVQEGVGGEHQKHSGKENAAFFFAARMKRKESADDTACVTKLEPALTLIPVLMRGKCI